MRKTVFVLAMVIGVFSCAGYCNATIIGTIESSHAGSDLGEFTEMNFSIYYPQPLPTEPGPINGGWDQSVSLSWNVTPDDVGTTFSASADTHQSFETFTSYLTNGIDDSLVLTDSTVSNFPAYAESSIINGVHEGVDFEGYAIDRIALTVNDFLLDLDYDPGPISIGHTNYSYDITYTIYGSPVPEPCTVLLLGFGGLILRGRHRQR